MPARNSNEKKVFDVTRPSQVAPNSTSKPVIVGHKPLVGDPMVRQNVPVSELSATDTPQKADKAATAASSAKLKKSLPEIKPSDELVERVHHDTAAGDSAAPEIGSALPDYEPEKEKTIEPPAPEESAVPHAPRNEDEQSTDPATPKAEDEQPAEEAQPEPPTPEEKPAEQPESNPPEPEKPHESNDIDSVLGAAQSEKEGQIAEVTRQEAADKMIEAGTYQLQLGKPPRHKNKNNTAIFALVMILIVVILGYLAIDAGIIKTSFALPYHFFKQASAPVVEAPTTTPVVKPTPTPTPASTPTSSADTSSYTMVNAGITFSYPKAWGNVLVTPEKGYSKRSPTAISDGTYAYIATFSVNKDVEVVATSNKYLPTTRERLYYDYLEWCSMLGPKYYQSMMTYKTAAGVDTPDKSICDQGPLTGASTVDTSTLMLTKAMGGTPPVMIGDVYIKNLTPGTEFPVLHVKDATQKNTADIKKMLASVKLTQQ